MFSSLNLKMDGKQNSEWKFVSDFASIPTADWNEMIIHHFTDTVEYSMTTHITARMVSDARFYPFYAGFYFASNSYGGACIGIKKSKETTEFVSYGFQINNQARTHHCTICYR